MTEYESLVVTDVAHDPIPEHTSRFDSVGLRSDYGCVVPEWRSERGLDPRICRLGCSGRVFRPTP